MNECKKDPRAPHGFLRNESHTQDRYVCECEYWEPPEGDEMKKAMSHYDEAFLLSLSDRELIALCKKPPRDLEFNELKIAADILADRYDFLLTMEFPEEGKVIL